MPRDRDWRDPATLLDILNAARRIRTYVMGHTRDSFVADSLTCDAVILQVIVVGEATKRLSPEFRRAHPQIPWANIAGMRNNLVHGYDAWDLEEVWRVAHADVPALIVQLEPLVPPDDV